MLNEINDLEFLGLKVISIFSSLIYNKISYRIYKYLERNALLSTMGKMTHLIRFYSQEGSKYSKLIEVLCSTEYILKSFPLSRTLNVFYSEKEIK